MFSSAQARNLGLPKPEPWWIIVWLLWGLVGGTLLGVADRSLLEGTAWLLLGVLAGLFGEGILYRAVTSLVSGPTCRLPLPTTRTTERDWLVSYLEHQFTVSEQGPLRTWKDTLVVACAVGGLHGFFWLSLAGTLAGFESTWQTSSLQGALAGAAMGPPYFALIAFVVFTCCRACERHADFGPVWMVLRQASEEAKQLVHAHLGAEHLLLAIARTVESPAGRLLGAHNASLGQLRLVVLQRIGLGPEVKDPLGRDVDLHSLCWHQLSSAIRSARFKARRYKHCQVRGEHLLLVLLQERTGVVCQILTEAGVDVEVLRQELVSLMEGNR